MAVELTEYDVLLKVVVVGDEGIGKSSLVKRFVEDEFKQSPYLTTVGVDFSFRTIRTADKTVKLQLWDTSGSERFRSITSSYYRGAHLCFVVFDVTNSASFEHVHDWIHNLRTYNDHAQLVIVGNKTDLESKRVVDNKSVAELLHIYNDRENSLLCVETSAKTGQSVERLFFDASARYIREKLLTHQPTAPALSLSDPSSSSAISGSCCKS